MPFIDNPAALSCGCDHQQVHSPYALPDGTDPLIVLDFKNGIYMSDGEAVALGDLVAENVNYGAWSPSDIEPGVGLAPGDHVSLPTLTGDALSLVLGGSTALYTVVSSSGGSQIVVDMQDFENFEVIYQSAVAGPDIGQTYLTDNVAEPIDDPLLSAGTHKIALTFIDGKLSRSTDGAAIITINPADPWTPPPDFYGIQVENQAVLEKIALYPPQDDADLPSLSAL